MALFVVSHAPTGSSSTEGRSGHDTRAPFCRKGGTHSTRWRTTSRATQPSPGAGLSHAPAGTARTVLVNPPATFWYRAPISLIGRHFGVVLGPTRGCVTARGR